MGHAQTKYLNPNQLDVYQDIYDVVEKLNGDYEPFPTEIETFHGQRISLRDSNGYLVNQHRVINLGKDEKFYKISDNYSSYLYLNFIAVHCWIDTAVIRSPASLNHISVGFNALGEISLSDKAFSSENAFSKEIAAQLSAIIIKNKDDQLRIRHFPITNSGLSITPILIHPITGIMACPISSCGRPQSATGIYLMVCCFLIDSPVRVIR
ncbi:hypothetical protein [Alteromonas alba]|uniref:hypothetical protein n=1 Tax=Alteromonas alba TaxID=2079529 RepID=UPI0011B22C85|nr:hypothetical protein [Alteromonas alba]